MGEEDKGFYLSTMSSKRLSAIEARNKRVELDKAWETSWTRKIIVAVLTYFVAVLFFFAAGLPKPFVNSMVPTMGFILSTLSLDYLKGIWIKKQK